MLNPFTLEHRWVWRFGAIGFWGLALLVCLAAFRKRLKMSYEWWHVMHALIATVALSSALVHVYLVGYDSSRAAMRVLWSLYLIILFGLVVRYRILRPLKMWRKPWEVVDNIAEHGNARTLVLHPIDHNGFTFEPGQFAWLNTGKTPFHFDQHPISISSSAENGPNCEIAFTIKALGDWSGKAVPALKPGTRVWLDGPYGVFSTDRDQGPGYVMIAGGVGITPLHSMCETLAMRDDCRPIVLFYAADEYDELIFREELEKLRKRMNLKLVYVLEKPSLDWEGEQGHITAQLLWRWLPKQYKRFQFFMCGPTPLMDAVERELREIGVSAELVHSERFDLV
jgi:predicted ferric reductase